MHQVKEIASCGFPITKSTEHAINHVKGDTTGNRSGNIFPAVNFLIKKKKKDKVTEGKIKKRRFNSNADSRSLSTLICKKLLFYVIKN